MLTRYYNAIVICILTCMAVVSVTLAWNDSLTFDEVAHIPAGYSYVTQHDYRLNPEHPPLLKVCVGLAMYPLHPAFDITQDFWTTANSYGEYGQWDAGRHLLHHAGNNTDVVVFVARLPIIIISLLFGWFLFYWGKKIGGVVTGLFALILYACDPNILGHNHFVTTDIGIAAAIGVAFFAFLHFLKNPTWTYALYGGIALGVAQVTKFSAIMLIPFFGLLLVIYPLICPKKENENRITLWGHYFLKGLCALCVMVGIIWITYLPVTYNMPKDVLPPITEIKAQPEKYARDTSFTHIILWSNQYTATRPFAAYAQGLMQVLNRVDDGNVTYFMGTVSSDASRWYFPFVFTAKQTPIHLCVYLTMFLVVCSALFTQIRVFCTQNIRITATRLRDGIVAHFHSIALALFILLYSYISITGNLTIGFRHLFPMMPLLYILSAKICVDAYKKITIPHIKKRITQTAMIFALLLITIVAHAYPYYMSYFNLFVGGPKNGYHYVTDSNADWGQDLKRLKKYVDRHPDIDTIRISYFGGDDIHNRFGAGNYILWWDSKRPIEPGYYALSTFFLQESIYDTRKTDDESYRWTQNHSPIDHVGTSFLIYKVE